MTPFDPEGTPTDLYEKTRSLVVKFFLTLTDLPEKDVREAVALAETGDWLTFGLLLLQLSEQSSRLVTETSVATSSIMSKHLVNNGVDAKKVAAVLMSQAFLLEIESALHVGASPFKKEEPIPAFTVWVPPKSGAPEN
jgi:hypothetical protein